LILYTETLAVRCEYRRIEGYRSVVDVLDGGKRVDRSIVRREGRRCRVILWIRITYAASSVIIVLRIAKYNTRWYIIRPHVSSGGVEHVVDTG
jgi:hypothetical protein